MQILFYLFLVFLIVATLYIFITSFVNFFFFKKKSKIHFIPEEKKKLVSILIPARDEEKDLPCCLDSLLNQTYSDIEILILDDHSHDSTPILLAEYEKKDKRIKSFRGGALPEGWKGKTFALHQLGEKAKGDYLLCLDADMVAKPQFVEWALSNLLYHQTDSLSAWPQHYLPSFSQNFLMPVIYLCTGFLIPLQFIYRTKTPLFSHAIGQFIIFQKQSYQKIGGYQSIHEKINDDINIAREVKRSGLRHIFIDAKNYLAGNMYDNFSASVKGISRTLYEYFDWKLYPIIILSIFILSCIVAPPFLAVVLFLFGSIYGWVFLLASLLFLFSWMLTLLDRRMAWYAAFLYPIQMLFIIFCAWKSVFLKNKGYEWKGRFVK